VVVLSQADEEKKRVELVVTYANMILTKSERYYCITREELLALDTFLISIFLCES